MGRFEGSVEKGIYEAEYDAFIYPERIIISRDQHLYMVEEVASAAMETGTVSLNIEAMRSAIEESGKIAVYDIHFATGSAVIEPGAGGGSWPPRWGTMSPGFGFLRLAL